MARSVHKISAAESQVMEAVWRHGPTTTEQIVADVGEPNGWTRGTVKTLVARLLRKRALEGRRSEQGYFYHALLPRSDYLRAESQGVVDRLFGGEVAPFVAHFAEHRALTPEDLRRLKDLVKRLEDE